MDEIIGKRLRMLRKQADWSQQDVANEMARLGLDVHQTHVSAMEGRGTMPSISVLIGLVKVYNTNADYILGLTDDPRSIASMQQTVARVVPDDISRAILADVLDVMIDLPPSSQNYIAGLVKRLFANAENPPA